MKLRIVSFTILCLALTAVPAAADLAPGYDNGPINGTTDAWTINFGYVVSNTFTGISYAEFLQFGVWEFPGDTLSSVDWSITSAENGGTVYGQGTASGEYLKDKFLSTNQYGYNIDLIYVWATNVRLDPVRPIGSILRTRPSPVAIRFSGMRTVVRTVGEPAAEPTAHRRPPGVL